LSWINFRVQMGAALLAIWIALTASAQEQPQSPQTVPIVQPELPKAPGTEVNQERWNLYFQATSIGQYHGTFHSPYEGPFSLQNTMERDVSLTTTAFLGLRLAKHTFLYFNPEIAGGRGFSGVEGLANSSNGELPRVASAAPKPYVARLYVSHDFALGNETESFESSANQLGGRRPVNRYTVTVGRFTLTDFFDNNRYSHDPRSQFMGWSVMYNGAWDYPADVRGYTWGWVHEAHTRNWSFSLRQRGDATGCQRAALRPSSVSESWRRV
jgi:high affinity Mn2+ porin